METGQYATKQVSHVEFKEGIKKNTLRQIKWVHSNLKSMGYRKSSGKREVYSNTSLLQQTRKILNKQPNLILVKEEETNPKVSRRKEVIKIREGKIRDWKIFFSKWKADFLER